MKFAYFADALSVAGQAGMLAFILVLVFAAAPPAFAALYSPGQTLDPACAPTDLNCGISTLVASSTANSIPYYATNGGILSATSTVTILSNGNVGIGTTSPFTLLSVAGNGYFSGNLTAFSASTTNATSTTFYTNSLTAGNIYAPIQQQNLYILRSTYTKIAAMQTNAPAQLRIVKWGDSVAGFHAGPLITKLQGELGDAGFIIGGTINSTSGGVTSTSGDFTSTPTGSYENIGSGGCVVYGNGGGYVSANKLSLLYIAEPGAGTLTLNTNLNGAGYIAGQSVNAANSIRIGGVLATTTSSTGPWTIQACASGGPVKVWGPGFENTSVNGVVVANVAQGGIALSDMNYPSTAITGPWFAAIDPDMVTFEMKNNGAIEPVTATRLQDLNTFVADWQAANPLTDFLLIGSSPVTDPTQVPYNQILASVAASNDAVYWDGYSPAINYTTEKALGWITDSSNPHQTALGQSAESNLLWSQLGLGSLINATSTNNVSNQLIKTNALIVAGPGSGSNDTGIVTFYSGNVTGTQASITSSWWNGGDMTFTAPRDLNGGGTGFLFNSNSGTTRLYIDSYSGNVGIGSTTPAQPLSVAGKIYSSVGGFQFPDGTVQTTAASGGGSQWTTSGSNIYYSDGFVGVGTNSPLSLFTVASSTATTTFTGTIPLQFAVQDSGGSGKMTGIDFVDFAGANNYPKARIAMSDTGTGSSLYFGTSINFNQGITNTALSIGPNGNVGISSSSPSQAAALDVSGSEFITGNETFFGNNPQITFTGQYNGATDPGFINYNPAGAGFVINAGRSGYNPMLFQTVVGNVSYTRMIITNAGNVGVGTSTPFAKLDVAGANNATAPLFQLSSVTSFATTTQFIVTNGGKVGIGSTSPATELEVGGSSANVTFDGYLNCSGFTSNANGLLACTASDQRLKQEIASLDASSTIAALNALNPVSFYWKPETDRGTQQQYGLIAQQVESVFPNLVSTSSPTSLTPDGTLTVNYDGLIAPIIMAIQQLGAEVRGFAQSVTTAVLNATTINSQQDNTQQLCIGPTCINESQLKALLNQSNQGGSAPAPAPPTAVASGPPSSNDASTTDATSSLQMDASTATTTDSTATSTDDSTATHGSASTTVAAPDDFTDASTTVSSNQ